MLKIVKSECSTKVKFEKLLTYYVCSNSVMTGYVFPRWCHHRS